MNYPDMIKNLPEAEVPFTGVKAVVSQADDHQIVFFEFDAGVKVPPHKHCEQWGIVVEGEFYLTINGKEKRYKAGESYSIPANVIHEARFPSKCKAMDFFADKDRYKLKMLPKSTMN